jgi:hypothetical protein
MTDVLSAINGVLQDPAVQAGIGVLGKFKPEIGLALELVTVIAREWQTSNEINAAIRIIDNMIADHIRVLATTKMSDEAQFELEVRLHELLTIVLKIQ